MSDEINLGDVLDYRPPSNHDPIAFLARHLVALVVPYKFDGVQRTAVVTTLVLSVDEEWFLVTAGHVLKKLHQLFESRAEVVLPKLFDHFAEGATQSFPPIPFDLMNEERYILGDENGFDFAAIRVRELYQTMLCRNGIVPLNEYCWRLPPPSVPEHSFVIGYPADLASSQGFGIAVVPVRLFDIQQQPDPESGRVRFSGEVPLGTPGAPACLKNIEGMSGGPLFAFCRLNGEMRYWLIGIQSTWVPQTNTIHACASFDLGIMLERILAGESPLGSGAQSE